MYKIINYYKKKNKTFLLGLILFLVGVAQLKALLTESFNYPNSTALTSANWANIASAGTNNVTAYSGNLTYSGTIGNTIGNKATLTDNGQDVSRSFTSTNVTTSVPMYVSMVVNVSDAKTGDYFFMLGGVPVYKRAIADGTSTGAYQYASYGEVEDYLLTVTRDFGDAPLSYENGSASTAASQTNNATTPELYMGNTIDFELVPASVTSPADNNGTNGDGADEDAVSTPQSITSGAPFSVTIPVKTTVTGTKYLYAWIDFNGDGIFNGNEAVTATPSVTAESTSNTTRSWTSTNVSAAVKKKKKTYVRFRLSDVALTNANSATTTLIDTRSYGVSTATGEIEDYQFLVDNLYDYGDVPVSYEKPGGIFLPARQASSSSLFIGGIPDKESTPASVSAGANNNGSNGDGLDEDGVADPSLYPLSYNAAYSMSVKVTNITGSTQTLYGWVDFDNNGTFEATEVATVNVPTGTNNGTVVLNWPADASTNTAANYAYVRLRLSANTLTDFSGTAYDDRAIADGNNNSGYGASTYGEIEDYKVSATPQPNTGAVIGSSGDVFLRGKYIEGGIRSDYGVFGARNNSTRPIGYHSSRSNLYGFIANQAKNNWQTYNGDYFTPGTPEEGFTVTIGSSSYSNNNTSSTYQVTGGTITGIANNTVPFNGSTASTVDWEGSVAGIKVHHQYMITRNGLYIRMVTTLTNTSASTINDIYYLRNLDPDNNVSINGGNYVTTNTIEKQTSTTNNISRVSATQSDGSYMSYYSEDPRAKVTVGGFSNRNAKAVYNGTGFTQTLGYTNTDDKAISIAFKIGSLAPGASTDIEYYYLLDDVPSPIQTSCYKPGVTGTGLDTKMGITTLGRAGTDNGNWPMVRKGAWMALEAQSKGFVINRVKFNATNQPVADDGTTLVITSPVEGMMVFDKTNNCLKIYTTPDDGATFSWQCINTQTCPD